MWGVPGPRCDTAPMLEATLTGMAVVLALTQPVPQVVRLLRTRSTAGVSGPTAWLGLVINGAWMSYGVARHLVPVAGLSAAYVAGYALVVWLLTRSGERQGSGSAALATGAFAAIALIAGWGALGTVLALVVGVQFVPQLVTAWRSDDLTALAPGTYVVCAMDGLVWGTFGVAANDAPLMLYGVVMVTVAVLILVPHRRWARTAASPLTVGAPVTGRGGASR